MGSGTVAKSPIPPNMLGYDKDLKTYDYDPESESAAEAGGAGEGL